MPLRFLICSQKFFVRVVNKLLESLRPRACVVDAKAIMVGVKATAVDVKIVVVTLKLTLEQNIIAAHSQSFFTQEANKLIGRGEGLPCLR